MTRPPGRSALAAPPRAEDRLAGPVFDLLLLVAGLALPLAFAPWGWFPVAWVALVPLLAVTADPRAGRRFRRGLLFGLGLFGFGLHWLLPTIHTFGNMPLVLAVPTWLLLVAYCALYPALFAALGGRVGGSPAARLLVGLPLLWVALEGLRGVLFTGFPWLTLGVSQLPGPLAGLFPVAGALGAGLVVVALNGALVLSWRQAEAGEWPRAVAVLGLGGVLVGAGALVDRVPWSQPQGAAFEAALIQGAVPQTAKWDPERREAILARYRQLSREHLDAGAVIWPETAVPVFADQMAGPLGTLFDAARRAGTTMVAGVPERAHAGGSKHYFNSVVTHGPGGEARYRKRHLVPFGEYVPLRELLFFAEKFVPGSGTFRPGTDPAPLTVNGRAAGMSICYEDAFAAEVAATVRGGAEVLINVTNDAWFGRTIGPDQHAQLARARAREMARPLLRVANTGLTFATDHRGQVRSALPPDEPGVDRVRVQPRVGATPFQHVADWLPWGLVAAFAVYALISRRYRPKPVL